MKQKMIVFDADGVLINGRLGGFKDILIFLDKKKEVQKIDQEYQKRKEKGPWGLEKLSELYQGFSENELKEAAVCYCKDNLMQGAEEAVVEIKKNDYTVGSLSSNPQFIMDALKKILLLDFSEGTQLEFKKGIATGKIKKKVDRYIKAELLKKKINKYHFRKENVFVVGDSITDLPMVKFAGFFIAFNPKEQPVKERANKIIRSLNELKKIL